MTGAPAAFAPNAMTRERARAFLLLILLAGAFFRFTGINWDHNHHLHPDERFISMVDDRLAGGGGISGYFDSARSTWNPYNQGFGSFVYGTLPMLLARALGSLVGLRGYDATHLVGRALSGAFDLASVLLVYRIVRRFAGRRTALAGAGFLAFAPLAIQLSHFWTVDTFLTAFSAATLLAAVRIAQGHCRPSDLAAAGIATGLAVSCKVTGLSLLLPIGAALAIGEWSKIAARPSIPPARVLPRALLRLTGQAALLLAAAAATVRVAFPYAFLGRSVLSFRLDPRWLKDLTGLASLTGSVAGFPPNFQWAGRTILFPIRNIVLWGAGPFWSLFALAALVWGVVCLLRGRRLALAPLVLHTLFLLAYHGLTMAKSMRYLYVIYPALAALAAIFLEALPARAPSPGVRRVVRMIPAAALAATFLCAVAFSSIYRRENSRIAATRWIYGHVPAGERFVNEVWDDGLPMPIPGYEPERYSGPQIGIVGPDNPRKVEEIVDALVHSEWIALTSNRAYGSLTRIPDVFPMSRAYYRALFENRLGYDRAADVTSYPSLGALEIPDDRAEEAFTVYDHPRVLLFRKNRQFSAARVRSILSAAMPSVPPTLNDWERFPRSRRRVTAALVPGPGGEAARKAAAPASAETGPGSLSAALLCYAVLALAGALASPLAYALFPRLPDRGFGLARILGLAAATYAFVLLVHARIFANGRPAALFAFALLGAASAVVFALRGRGLRAFWRTNRRSILEGEAVFLIGFLLFLGIRAFNPEIFWGEKPMDFSILNILVRTRTLPASDPWFAGVPLSYYTFGHEIVAFLSLVTGISTRYTFNLAFGLLGGATLQAAFTLARNWAGTKGAAIVAGALTALIGNLSGPREWLVHKRALNWDYFWATSRVIKDTINEYPLWSLVFADLHAHVLAIPLLLFLLACGLAFVRTHADPASAFSERCVSAALLGAGAAVVGLTNAWDVPLLAGLLPLFAGAAALGAPRRSGGAVARALLGLAIAAGSALLLAAPLWVRAGGRPNMGRSPEGAAGIDVLTVFGLFFFLAFAWALSTGNETMARNGWNRPVRWILLALALLGLILLGVRRIDVLLGMGVLLFLVAAAGLRESPERRLALALVAAAFFLVLFPQRFFIYDRMNTFFKLYLEAWLLFAISTSVLLFGRSGRGRFVYWPLPFRALAVALVFPAAFTAITAVRGALQRHAVAYSGPSLDGLRYLKESRPGEYRAVTWLRDNVRGTPVLLEAHGPSYQDYGRISMLTGLPTVLGWDYHVMQRGNPEAEIASRREAIERIYRSPKADAIEGLLRRYHVGYVYVGALERKTYCERRGAEEPCRGPGAGLAKFDAERDLFQLAYENPEARIYRVAAADTEDVVTPIREAIPAAEAAAAAPADEPEQPPSISETAAPGLAPYAGMREPRDGAVDGRGRLWVADFGMNRIRLFDSDGGSLGGWGGRGSGNYQLREPCGVAIHGDFVYVADTWNGRVQMFTLAGEWKAVAAGLFGPRAVTVAPDGTVWASDTGNQSIVSWDPSLSTKKTVGKAGAAPGEFSGPVGIAASTSAIYVADVGNHRIQVLAPSGQFRAAWPFPGWKEWGEAHLETDGDRVYAADPGGNAVLAFDAAGKLLERWTAGESRLPFSRPTGLALDANAHRLYVVNSGDNSVARIDLSEARGR